jgi:DNA-directed RNA polymerase omega subunit
LKDFSKIDSKYRCVIIASKRAKELLKGAKSRIKSKSKNPVRIAQKEVKMGLVEFEILKTKKEDLAEQEERVFIGEEVGGELEEEQEEVVKANVEEAEAAGEQEGEAETELSEEFEPLEDVEEEKPGEEEG